MDEAILIEARKRCDENDRLPHAGSYTSKAWDSSSEMIRELEEILMEIQAPKYEGVMFRDCFMRPVIVNENLSLRAALDWLDEANKQYTMAARREGLASSRMYAIAQNESKEMRRNQAVAKANAEAAMFRTTGRWPHSFYDLGLR